jgi:hypothetical protein
MMHYIVVILFLFYASPSVGRTFYVSSSLGDDSRSITEAQNETTPWKSLSQVNSVMNQLLPGDSVLLCRGDVFFDKVRRIYSIILKHHSYKSPKVATPHIASLLMLMFATPRIKTSFLSFLVVFRFPMHDGNLTPDRFLISDEIYQQVT